MRRLATVAKKGACAGLPVLVAMVAVLAAGMVQAVTIDTVFVGNPGNAGEGSGASYGGYGPDAIVGAVGYPYKMGKYEVTNAQYCEFLNGKLPSISDPESGTVLTNDTYGCFVSTDMAQSRG